MELEWCSCVWNRSRTSSTSLCSLLQPAALCPFPVASRACQSQFDRSSDYKVRTTSSWKCALGQRPKLPQTSVTRSEGRITVLKRVNSIGNKYLQKMALILDQALALTCLNRLS
ncbi:unnamed protein product [Oikopleura dioica]|uniref:Uncharacterized protein n=1 Tax=Oikopleura dioica TaxID=34765 RepID=E4XRI1_OIKDI|nr:unnamed protein product [Oikopleura dioica]